MDLTMGLQDTLEYGPYELRLDMSFDNIILFNEMLEDPTLGDIEKVVIGLEMLLPWDYDLVEGLNLLERYELFSQIMRDFLDVDIDTRKDSKCDDSEEGEEESEPQAKSKEFDFKVDAERIYASFMMDYGIDLIEEQGKMHWKKFVALLGGLSERTPFMQVVNIRTMEVPKKDNRDSFEKHKQKVLKAKRKYALNQTMKSADDVFQDMITAFGGRGD